MFDLDGLDWIWFFGTVVDLESVGDLVAIGVFVCTRAWETAPTGISLVAAGMMGVFEGTFRTGVLLVGGCGKKEKASGESRAKDSKKDISFSAVL